MAVIPESTVSARIARSTTPNSCSSNSVAVAIGVTFTITLLSSVLIFLCLRKVFCCFTWLRSRQRGTVVNPPQACVPPYYVHPFHGSQYPTYSHHIPVGQNSAYTGSLRQTLLRQAGSSQAHSLQASSPQATSPSRTSLSTDPQNVLQAFGDVEHGVTQHVPPSMSEISFGSNHSMSTFTDRLYHASTKTATRMNKRMLLKHLTDPRCEYDCIYTLSQADV